MANETKVETKSEAKVNTIPKLKVDISKVVSTVRAGFGKDKASALQIATGSSVTKPSKDSDFVVWRNSDGSLSPWEALTGIRGIPFGMITSVEGKSNSGKSSTAMMFMKKAQEQGVLVILVDSENKFSKDRFDKLFGGNSDDILITTSKMILESGNHVEQIVHAVMEQNPNQKILVVIDSLGGLLPRNEGLEFHIDASKQMAAAAKDNGSLLRRIVSLMEKYKNREINDEMIACLLINQTYAQINSPGQTGAGGAKVAYYSSIIVQLTRRNDLTKIKNGVKVKYGILSRAKVAKNHLHSAEITVSELPIIITAGDIILASEKKTKASEEGDEELVVEDD